ncbi:MAG: toll/interleukin-1 receptor domain-containing protein [Acidobacteriota bacterium]|nr:toll/interleukin-1 receptor domain-containing protein [Acidobacteriota bacterium]
MSYLTGPATSGRNHLSRRLTLALIKTAPSWHTTYLSATRPKIKSLQTRCATLETKGIRCWIAPRDILPGEKWPPAIVSAINGCQLVVLIFSSNANVSPQVEREIQRAFEKG